MKIEQDEEKDPLLADCMAFAKREGRVRVGILQRNFKLGYFRASRIMAQMEQAGILDENIGKYHTDRIVKRNT